MSRPHLHRTADESVAETVSDAADAAVDAVLSAAHDAQSRGAATLEQAALRLESAAGAARQRAAAARLAAGPAAVAAKDWVAPRVAEAMGEAKDWAQPRVGLVVQRAEPVVDEAWARSTAALSALRGEVPVSAVRDLVEDRHAAKNSRGHSPWVRLLLVLALLAAAAAAVKLVGRKGGETWQPASGPLGQAASSHPAATAAPVADPEALAEDDGGSPVVGVSDGLDVAVTAEDGTTQESTDLLPGAEGESRGPA